MNTIRTMLILLLITASSYAKVLKITTSNAVIINEPITNASVTTAIQSLAALDAERTNAKSPIYLVLNSPGGSIMAGNKLINFTNNIENVNTVCMFCASMAHAISQSVKGIRYATVDNIMMAHRARGGFSGQFGDGELEQRLALFKKIVLSMEKRNANRIGITLKRYKELVKDEWWTYAEESKQLNVVDELITLQCSNELRNKKIRKTTMTIFGPVEGPEVSACPLM